MFMVSPPEDEEGERPGAPSRCRATKSSSGGQIRKQAIGLALDHRVAFATERFQLRTVENGDVPSAVPDHAEFL